MTFVATLHVGQSHASAYAAPGVRLGMAEVGGLGAVYEELARRQTLGQWARSLGWDGEEPLIIVAWSAGVFAVRSWLQREQDTAVPRLGLLLLDGLHGGPAPGVCSPELLAGVVRFGREAAAQPQQRMLVNTCTEIEPPYSSTSDCQAYLDEMLPRSSAVQLLDYPGDDDRAHRLQVREIGPQLLHDILLPWATEGRLPGALISGRLVAAVAVAVAATYAAWSIWGQ